MRQTDRVAITVGDLGPRVRWAFADRTDGVSLAPYDRGNLADHVGDDPAHVEANRGLLAAAVGLSGSAVVAMAPVHGAGVAVVDALHSGPIADVDALVTCTPGLALLTLAADCVPVVLGDSRNGVVGVVHSGWKGVVVDVVGATIAAMRAQGADDVSAVVGPAICGACYPVSRERFDEVVASAPTAAARARDGQPALDLRAAVVDRMRSLDVATTTHGGCTFEDPTLFSYRRDAVTGRHGAIVTLIAEAT